MTTDADPSWSRRENECRVTAWTVWCGWGWHDIYRYEGHRAVPHDVFLAGDLQAEIERHLGEDVLAEVIAVVRDAPNRPAFQAVWAEDHAKAVRWQAIPVDERLAGWPFHPPEAAVANGLEFQRDVYPPRPIPLPGGGTLTFGWTGRTGGSWSPSAAIAPEVGEPMTTLLHDKPKAFLLDDTGIWVRGEELRLEWLPFEGERERQETDEVFRRLGLGPEVRVYAVARWHRRVVAAYWAHGLSERSQMRAALGQRGIVELTPGRGVIARSPPG